MTTEQVIITFYGEDESRALPYHKRVIEAVRLDAYLEEQLDAYLDALQMGYVDRAEVARQNMSKAAISRYFLTMEKTYRYWQVVAKDGVYSMRLRGDLLAALMEQAKAAEMVEG